MPLRTEHEAKSHCEALARKLVPELTIRTRRSGCLKVVRAHFVGVFELLPVAGDAFELGG